MKGWLGAAMPLPEANANPVVSALDQPIGTCTAEEAAEIEQAQS